MINTFAREKIQDEKSFGNSVRDRPKDERDNTGIIQGVTLKESDTSDT